MKTLTNKRGFFAVAAALLALTVMFVTTWCSNDINTNDEYTPPEGKGAVRLSFDEKIARTILPATATLASFDEFTFTFTPTPSGTAVVKTVPKADLYDPIVLDPGTYDLIVIAYLDMDLAVNGGSASGTSNMQPAATNATAVSVTIAAAKTTSAVIVLKAYDPAAADGGGNGTFKYNITCSIAPADIDTADMSLTPIGTGTADSIDISSEMDSADYSIAVKAGYYYVDFIIKVKSGETVTFRHILQIYQNMTSSYAFTISASYFNAVFQLISGDLTYVHPQDKLPLLTENSSGSAVSIAEGGTVTVTQGDDVTIAVTNTTDYTSYEWYSGNTTSLVATASYTVETDTGDKFNEKRTYLLTIVGVASDGKKYYTFINIEVQ